MSIKWEKIMETERRQFGNMGEADRFVYFLLLQFGSPYGWGKENPETSDCSGAVCMALYAATGLLIRTAADDLYRRVFTVKNPGQDMIRAAFFIDGKTGKATHVAGLVDEGVILNSQEPGARVRELESVSAWFWNKGSSTAVRGLDRGAFAKLAGAGNAYGLDSEWGNYFE
ncbi:MAG: C40 family peptidase [Treponema sp.]|jgi:murein DD-endopeptidase|nr:C40 family peptidase [Treponema sp.]